MMAVGPRVPIVRGRRVSRAADAAGDRCTAGCDGQTWAGDLAAYERHLAAGRKIAPATTRMYVASAAALLRKVGVDAAAGLTQAHVRRYLQRYRGRRTNVMRFLSWVSASSGAGFNVGKARRTKPRKREKATLQ